MTEVMLLTRLIMIGDTGFYPINCLRSENKTMEECAKAHGELNHHVNTVTDLQGKVLWERTKQ